MGSEMCIRDRPTAWIGEAPQAANCSRAPPFPPRVRPVRGGSEGGITCVVTALLKVTRRRFAARFRARFRAFFLDPGIQPLPVPDPAPHGSAPCAAAALLLPLHPGPRYAQPLSYPYC